MDIRRIVVIVAAILITAVVGYLGVGVIVYDRLSRVAPACTAGTNTPDRFSDPSLDTTPYLMPDYVPVEFASREPRITIRGWYVGPAQGRDLAAVILVHGLDSCKADSDVLLPAGMLARNGFAVLLIDLRDHGESTREDGRFAGGTDEYRDVLGAWDWLITSRGFLPQRIGLAGYSLGAGSVLIAAGEEPRVAAVWEDSSFSDLYTTIEEELARNGYPTLLAPAAIVLAPFMGGDDLVTLSPLKAMAKIGRRPLSIVHGLLDRRMSVHHASDLAQASRASGGEPDAWIPPDTGHTQAARQHPVEYEARLVEFFARALGR